MAANPAAGYAGQVPGASSPPGTCSVPAAPSGHPWVASPPAVVRSPLVVNPRTTAASAPTSASIPATMTATPGVHSPPSPGHFDVSLAGSARVSVHAAGGDSPTRMPWLPSPVPLDSSPGGQALTSTPAATATDSPVRVHWPLSPAALDPGGLLEGTDGEVVHRHAEWEKEIETLDRKEMELHQAQLRLVREQTAIFLRDLTTLQQEVATLRSSSSGRLEALERAVGESSQKHSQDLVDTTEKLENIHGRLDSHHSLLREHAAQHLSLQVRVDPLDGLLTESTTAQAQHLSLRQRVDQLETLLREVVGAQTSQASELEAGRAWQAKLGLDIRTREAHHASINERLDYLEGAVSDSTDRHGVALKLANEKMDHFHGRLAACEALSTAIDGLRGFHVEMVGEGQKRDARQTSLNERMDFLELSLGDCAGRSAKDVQAAHNKLDQLCGMLTEQQGALGERASLHATLQERVDYLEQSIGESINRHTRELEAHRAVHGRFHGESQAHETQHTSVVQRLNYLEKALGDSSDKHSQELDAARSRLEQVHGRVGEHHQQLLQHASLQERVKYLEKLVGDSADKHAQALADTRAELEQMRGRLTACEAHGPTIDGLKKAHSNLTSDKAKRDAKHSSMGERLEHLEQSIEHSVDKHARDLAFVHNTVDQLQSRVNFCEKHGTFISELQKTHTSLAAEKESLDHHHATLKSRLDFIEREHEDVSERHEKELDSIKANCTKLWNEAKSRDSSYSILSDRLEHLEGQVGSTGQNHAKELAGALEKLDKLHGRVSSCETYSSAIESLKKAHSSLVNDRAARDAHHATITERLGYLEQVMGDSADHHAQQLKAAHAQLDQLHGKISEECVAREAHHTSIYQQLATQEELHASVQERLRYLERTLGESADKHARELESAKAAHVRLSTDMKMREAHHASITERLDSIEALLGDTSSQHASEIAATKAKLENLLGRVSSGYTAHEEYMRTLLAQDREAREVHHATLQERVAYLEKTLGESADQHARDLESIKLAHGQLTKEVKARDARHISMAERLEQLDVALNDSSDRHARELQTRHELLERRLLSCEKSASANASIDSAEKAKVKELDRYHATMKERVDYIEEALGDSADRHAKELEALRSSHTKLQNETKARDAHQTSVSERLDYLEKLLGDSENRHLQELKAVRYKLDQQHECLTASCEDHAVAIDGLRKSHGSLADDRAARDAHHASMSERLDYLEHLTGDSANAQSQAFGPSRASLVERVAFVERQLGDSKERHPREAKAGEAHRSANSERHGSWPEEAAGSARSPLQRKLLAAHGRIEELYGQSSSHEAQGAATDGLQHSSMAERLAYLEKVVGDSADKQAREMAAACDRLDQLHGILSEEQAARDMHITSLHGVLTAERDGRTVHQASMEERLRFIESLISDSTDKLSDLHERLHGEVQLRTQHHESISEYLLREQRARESHETGVHGHLSSEKKAREANERLIQELLDHEKITRDRHFDYVQEQFMREKEARDKHHETQLDQLSRHRTITETAHRDLVEMIQKEKASHDQLSTMHQEALVHETAERNRLHDSANERLDSLQRTMNIFDTLIRKEMDERSKENRRIWDAIDNHTHDLSTQVITEWGDMKNPSEASAEGAAQRMVPSAPMSPAVRTLTSPVGTLRQLLPGPPVLDPVVRLQQPAISPTAVRVPSPTAIRTVATAVTPKQCGFAAPIVPAPPLWQPAQPPEGHEHHHEQRVERINCGHTRYFGEQHRPAEIVIE